MDEFKSLKLPLRVEVEEVLGGVGFSASPVYYVYVMENDNSCLFGWYADTEDEDSDEMKSARQIVESVNNYSKLAKENKRMREEIALFVGCSNILKKVLAIKEINKKDTYDKGLNYDYVQGYNNALDYIQETILRPALEEKDGE